MCYESYEPQKCLNTNQLRIQKRLYRIKGKILAVSYHDPNQFYYKRSDQRPPCGRTEVKLRPGRQTEVQQPSAVRQSRSRSEKCKQKFKPRSKKPKKKKWPKQTLSALQLKIIKLIKRISTLQHLKEPIKVVQVQSRSFHPLTTY